MAVPKNLRLFILSILISMIQTADITIFYTIPEEEEPPLKKVTTLQPFV
jgi:hypothetical protein